MSCVLCLVGGDGRLGLGVRSQSPAGPGEPVISPR